MTDFKIPYSIKKCLSGLGIPPCMKGYVYLCQAIQLVCEDGAHSSFSAEDLYMIIAHENATNAHCIERDIRTAIRDAQNHTDNNCFISKYSNTSVKKLIFILAEMLSSEDLWE